MNQPAPAPAPRSTVTPELRWKMIAEAAWYRFEKRGFVHGFHEIDWIDAEREIDALIASAGDTSGFRPQRDGHDDLVIIEGIGPKIAELCVAAGIDTFAKLAAADVATLQGILDRAGPRFAMAVPTTWPQQAALAARGDWAGLKKLQDALDGGKER